MSAIAATEPLYATPAAYPLNWNIAPPPSSNRFWAIPLVGIFIKGIILIPHAVVLYLLFVLIAMAQLVIWIPVLITGHYPGWAFGLNAGGLRWSTRMYAFLYGLTDRYPAFGFQADGDIDIQPPLSSSRLWAFPFLGVFIKWIILIPHFIVLYVLGIVLSVFQLIIWVPVLLNGRYPIWGFEATTGVVMWGARVSAFILGITDSYPPFKMN